MASSLLRTWSAEHGGAVCDRAETNPIRRSDADSRRREVKDHNDTGLEHSVLNCCKRESVPNQTFAIRFKRFFVDEEHAHEKRLLETSLMDRRTL